MIAANCLIKTQRTCFLFLVENTATKNEKQHIYFDDQNVNFFACAHLTLTVHFTVVVLYFYRVIETQFETNQHSYSIFFGPFSRLLIPYHI